jgi:Cu/Zn superoxide dismutase
MKRLPAAILTIALCLGGSASAQISPNDTGSGFKLGIQELNNSGQIGSVTLYRRGTKTLVAVAVDGAPGRPEAVTIHRGADCENVSAGATWRLNDLTRGHGSTLLDAPPAKLLSGNYSLLVYGGTSPNSHAVACGHLFTS